MFPDSCHFVSKNIIIIIEKKFFCFLRKKINLLFYSYNKPNDVAIYNILQNQSLFKVFILIYDAIY